MCIEIIACCKNIWFSESERLERGELGLRRKVKRESCFVEMDAFIHCRKQKSHEKIYVFTLNVRSG